MRDLRDASLCFETTNRTVARRRLNRAINEILVNCTTAISEFICCNRLQNPDYLVLWLDYSNLEIRDQRCTHRKRFHISSYLNAYNV